jgi:ankyrin repeat protein
MYAAAGGHKDVVEQLARRGAEVNRRNADGFTPMRLASSRDRQDVVLLLTRLGARE